MKIVCILKALVWARNLLAVSTSERMPYKCIWIFRKFLLQLQAESFAYRKKPVENCLIRNR